MLDLILMLVIPLFAATILAFAATRKLGVYYVEHDDGEMSMYIARTTKHALEQHVELFGSVGNPSCSGQAHPLSPITVADTEPNGDTRTRTARQWVAWQQIGLVGTTAGY